MLNINLKESSMLSISHHNSIVKRHYGGEKGKDCLGHGGLANFSFHVKSRLLESPRMVRKAEFL